MDRVLSPMSFEEALEIVLEQVKKVFPDYKRLESDDFSVILEAFAYMLALQDQKRVHSIKAMLLTTSKGEDLDNLCAMYGTSRIEGSYPYAEYRFSLSSPLKNDVLIPKRLELSDEGEHRAFLKENVLIPAGEVENTGIVEYYKKQSSAKVRCENILTGLTFALKAEALGDFEDGSEKESDEAFRQRSVLSLHSHTTAGSNKAYCFHAKSADSRIEDVAVFAETPGVVDVYLKSKGGVDDLMIQRVEEALNKDSVRPLTDCVRVYAVAEKEIVLSADVFVFNLKDSAKIAKEYADKFENRIFKIGEDLPLSEIIKDLHTQGVYKVFLKDPTQDVTPIDKKEVIKITSLEISFKEAPITETLIKGSL